MARYPVLVEHFEGAAPFVMGCNRCGFEKTHGDVDRFIEDDATGSCDACGEHAGWVPAYEQGQRCRGCGTLALGQPVDGCCSRACALQVEYAKTLGAA